jgi:hypothetical protein
MLQGAVEQKVKMATQVSSKWFSKEQPSASTSAYISPVPSISSGEPVKVEEVPVASESSNINSPGVQQLLQPATLHKI